MDALISLFIFSKNIEPPLCFPEFKTDKSPEFKARCLRHPYLISATTKTFVPSDINLSADSGNIMILTGPNMGGKSTLLRNICVSIILAQVNHKNYSTSIKFDIILL